MESLPTELIVEDLPLSRAVALVGEDCPERAPPEACRAGAGHVLCPMSLLSLLSLGVPPPALCAIDGRRDASVPSDVVDEAAGLGSSFLGR